MLAIVDIQPREGEANVWEITSDNSGQIFTFFFTFLVVGVMWLAHNPALLEPKAPEALVDSGGWGQFRGLVVAGIFTLIALVSAFSQGLASWMPFLLIPASIMMRSPSALNDVVEHTES